MKKMFLCVGCFALIVFRALGSAEDSIENISDEKLREYSSLSEDEMNATMAIIQAIKAAKREYVQNNSDAGNEEIRSLAKQGLMMQSRNTEAYDEGYKLGCRWREVNIKSDYNREIRGRLLYWASQNRGAEAYSFKSGVNDGVRPEIFPWSAP